MKINIKDINILKSLLDKEIIGINTTDITQIALAQIQNLVQIIKDKEIEDLGIKDLTVKVKIVIQASKVKVQIKIGTKEHNKEKEKVKAVESKVAAQALK